MANHKKAQFRLHLVFVATLLLLAALNLPMSAALAEIDTYTVIFQSDGNGQVTPTGPQTYASPGPHLISATPTSGYSFRAWEVYPPGAVTFDNPNLPNAQATIAINGSTVTATFRQDTYTISLTVLPSPTMGTVSLSALGPYNYADSVILTANPANGYSFDSWAGDGTNSGQFRVLTMTKNMSVSVFFTSSTYPLTLYKTGSGSVYANGTALINQATYHYQDILQLNAVAQTGWVFSGWTGSFTSNQNPVNIKINGTTSVAASFTHSEYSVTVNVLPSPSAGSFSSNQSGPLYLGDTVVLTATPSPGYSFNGWSGSGTGSDTTRTVTITGNMAVYLNFAQISYALSVSIAGSGSVNPTQGTYHYGDIVKLTATAAPGWGFSRWSNAFTSSVNPVQIIINGTTSVLASFTQTTYQVTLNAGSGGTVSPTGTISYLEGQYVPIQAIPADGYLFSAWAVSPASAARFDNANSATAVATINGNGLITATFTPKPSPTPSPSPSPTAEPTSSPTISPTANPTPIPSQPTPTPNRNQSPTPSKSPEPTPGPIPTLITIPVTAIDGSSFNITVKGVITNSNIQSAKISIDSSNTSTISLMIVAQSGSNAFGNVTIPKTAIPYDGTPSIYINNVLAAKQGYVQDSKNYFAWYSTDAKTYELSITFKTASPQNDLPLWILLIVIPVVALVIAIVLARKRINKPLTKKAEDYSDYY